MIDNSEQKAGRSYAISGRGLYQHILDSDQRYQAAANTNQKSGSAFQGGAGFEERGVNWLMVVVSTLALAGFLLWGMRH